MTKAKKKLSITVSRKIIPHPHTTFEIPNQTTMDFYFINTQPFDSESYELHTGNCYFTPMPHNRHYIGLFTHPKYALHKALKSYAKIYCCEICCNYQDQNQSNDQIRKSIQ